MSKAGPPDMQLNLNVRGLAPSATLAINERCAELARNGRAVFRLGLGQSPFPVPEPVVDALRANASQKAYLPVRGLPELCQAVAEYHRRRHQVAASGKDVLVGPGSKELMFLLQLVYYGDLVIPTPSWVSYAPQAAILGRQVRWLQTDASRGWRITAEELERLCSDDPQRPRIVVLNYPANPTGKTYAAEELRALAGVARRHRALLLSDEIYGELHYQAAHVSVATFYPEGTIISSGLSKWCGAGGWRLGTFTFPRALRWLLDAMAAVASETYTSTSAPIQYAAVRAFSGGIYIERYLRQVRRILGGLGAWISTRLMECGARVQAPDGAFYLFPDFEVFREKMGGRGIHTSRELCDRLLEETGVAMLPGSDFGRPSHELTARIAFVDFDGARALAAAENDHASREIDEEFLACYCGSVLKATSVLCEWLRG